MMQLALTFNTASRLWLLAAVAAIAVAYVVTQKRRRQYAVRFANLALLATVAPRRPGWRRHLPAALLLLAMISQVVALAHPARAERVPRDRALIVLAIDVSNSMAATDVEPTRLAAAEAAAAAFLDDIPERLNIALVAFSGNAQVLLPPTTDHATVRDAVQSLRLGPRTAIGEAVFTSLDVIELAQAEREADGEPSTTTTVPEGDTAEDEKPPAVVVLMSDGQTTTGRSDEEAAQAAVDAGVPVWTIAYGTDEGFVEFQGQVVQVPVNRPALAQLADSTGGRAFEAATGAELRDVYKQIGTAIGYDERMRDISGWFTAGALAFALLAAVASLLWFSRLP
jgi:Ca-activated chloride channel homolog